MKTLVLALLLQCAAGTACIARQAIPAAAYPAGATATQPISDSLRQVVHEQFKRGRLYGAVAAVAGGVVTGSNTVDAVKGNRHWSTVSGLVLGASALVLGTIDLVRFSRRRERQVLAALERGQPLPKYVTRTLFPFAR